MHKRELIESWKRAIRDLGKLEGYATSKVGSAKQVCPQCLYKCEILHVEVTTPASIKEVRLCTGCGIDWQWVKSRNGS